MDPIKIGRFIAQRRKARQMTQVQLADALHVSDKTISKWERGRGLPEVSLMLPLCEQLQISVNDLLSGECVCVQEYQTKAEANMMRLMERNEQNRRRYLTSLIDGGVTIVAVAALVGLASFVSMPAAARIALLVLALGTAACGLAAAVMLDREAGVFVCPVCQQPFVPSMHAYVKAYHTFTRRRLTCPHCGCTSLCKHRITS